MSWRTEAEDRAGGPCSGEDGTLPWTDQFLAAKLRSESSLKRSRFIDLHPRGGPSGWNASCPQAGPTRKRSKTTKRSIMVRISVGAVLLALGAPTLGSAQQ